MKNVFQIILLVTGNIIFGQRQNTNSLFYNLPIDSNSTYIQKVLLADTVNFETKMVGTWRNKSHVKVPFFYPKEKPSIYSLDIVSTHILIDTIQKVSDSTQKIEITICVRFGKKVKRGNAKQQYEKTIEFLRSDYDSLSNTYLLGRCRQKDPNAESEKYKEWKVYHHSTLFYLKTGTKENLNVTWTDERKHRQTLYISYILN